MFVVELFFTKKTVMFNLIIENMLRSAMLYKDRGDSTIKIKTDYKNGILEILFEDNGFGSKLSTQKTILG